MSKSALLRLPVLRWRRIPCIVLLFGITLFLWTSSPVSIAFAQSGNNQTQNANFETGSLDPYWVKWGYQRSSVNVWQQYNHTPNGSWSGYIIPDGRYVELQQVWRGNLPVVSGHRYYLSAFVTTNGMTAHVQWWANDNQPSRECGSTSAVWPTYVQISCEFTAPQNISQFNIHLGGNSVQGSGQWAASDDWHLTEIPPSTTNWYIGTVDNQVLYSLGSSMGNTYTTGVIILDFGQPNYANSTYGTNLFYPGNPFASTDQIKNAVEAFLVGYYYNSPSSAYVNVAIATNNYGNLADYYNHGQAWANMVNNVESWTSLWGYSSKLLVKGSSDMEPAWNTAPTTRSWADGYASAYTMPYYDVGSCDSCPSTACPTCQIANGWSKDDLWYVAYGVAPAYPLPAIYATSGVHADQWYRMSLYAQTNHTYAMLFPGTATQSQACAQKGCPDNLKNTPGLGWGQLVQWLNTNPVTARTLNWSTDWKWQY